MAQPYAGKTCVVVGAYGGNGGEMVKRLVEGGAELVFCLGRRTAKLQELTDKYGDKVYGFQIDLADTKRVDNLIAAIRRTGKKIDLFFHLAGTPVKDTKGMDSRDRSKLMAQHMPIHVWTPTTIIGRLFDNKLFNKGAKVGVVSSTGSGLPAPPELRTYAAIKQAMNEWVADHYCLYQAQGVHIVIILMGMVDTPMMRGPETQEFAPWFHRRLLGMSHTPEQCVAQILADVQQDAVVSYPGGNADLIVWEDLRTKVRWRKAHRIAWLAILAIAEKATRRLSHWHLRRQRQ